MNNKFIEINKKGWNELVKNDSLYSNTSLPEYGPYMNNEEKLNLLKDIKDKKVLELGCASGKSLEYLSKLGAKELWGLDISEEQIKKAKELDIPNSNFIVSPMEEKNNIPTNYFDYVLSLYSIGFSSNPIKTFELSNKYLKNGGKFIMCWIHPFFNCIGVENDRLVVTRNYIEEDNIKIIKGTKEVELMQNNLKISTIINGLINSGMEIDKIIEENPIEKNGIGNYKSPMFDERKLKFAPTTLIIVAHKKTQER